MRLVFFLFAFLAATPCFSQPRLEPYLTLEGQRDGTKAKYGDGFGSSAETSDTLIVVGAPFEEVDRGNAGVMYRDGAVYVYDVSDGSISVDPRVIRRYGSSKPCDTPYLDGDRFGSAVELAGRILIVGAANDQSFPPEQIDPMSGECPDDGIPSPPFSFAGRIVGYDIDTGLWTQAVRSPAPYTGAKFGGSSLSPSVAVSPNGDVLAVGERGDAPTGKILIFRKVSGRWALSHTVRTPLQSLDAFGEALAFASDTRLIAGGYDLSADRGTVKGVIYLYSVSPNGISSAPIATKWGAQFDVGGDGHLTACENAESPIRFGEAGLAAAKNVAVSCSGTALQGEVRLYDVTQRAFRHLATVSPSQNNMRFGANGSGSKNVVAISPDGTGLLVGAPMFPLGESSDPSKTPGAPVRYYRRSGDDWIEICQMIPSDPDDVAFGDSVYFADENKALVRANRKTSGGRLKGQLHVYQLADCT